MEQGDLKGTSPRGGLIDRHGRVVSYLRLSITDLCNLRCFYCMPVYGVDKLPHEKILRYEEMTETVRVAAELGIKKVRVTGGEPLIKRGAVKLVREIAAMPGIETVAMTTNGTRLEKYAEVLKEAGLKRVNVSLDSLRPEVYHRISRVDALPAVLRGIDKALEVGFPVKINTVLINGVNSDEVEGFLDFAKEKGVEVRFIERMSFEDNDPFVSQESVLDILAGRNEISQLPMDPGSPHVRLFECGGTRVGFISPRSRPFCDGCNKLRLTPNGRLKMCLASPDFVDVRAVLRRPHTSEDIAKAIKKAVSQKPKEGPWTAHAEMWRVGG